MAHGYKPGMTERNTLAHRDKHGFTGPAPKGLTRGKTAGPNDRRAVSKKVIGNNNNRLK